MMCKPLGYFSQKKTKKNMTSVIVAILGIGTERLVCLPGVT